MAQKGSSCLPGWWRKCCASPNNSAENNPPVRQIPQENRRPLNPRPNPYLVPLQPSEIVSGGVPGNNPGDEFWESMEIPIQEISINRTHESVLQTSPDAPGSHRFNFPRPVIVGLEGAGQIGKMRRLSMTMNNAIEKLKFKPSEADEAAKYRNFKVEGPFAFADGSEYLGHCQNGKRHGIGVANEPDGTYFNGFWVDNLYHGLGQMVYLNGECYIGEWQQGMKHGKGTFYYLNGNQLTCTWKGNVKSGVGTIWSEKLNKKFPVTYKDDLLDGNCTVFYDNGDYYTGMFTKGKKHNKGEYFTKKKVEDKNKQNSKEKTKETFEEAVYRRDYFYDVMQGYNCVLYDNGDEYIGFFENGKKSGKGEITHSSGWKYNGHWKDDMPHGEGTYEYGSAGRYSGNFENGQRKGTGYYLFSNQSFYRGEFDGGPKGPGVYTDVINGKVLQGEGVGNNKFKVRDTGEVINMKRRPQPGLHVNRRAKNI